MNILLQDIEQEILQSGGRYNLACRIAEENVNLFTGKYRGELKTLAKAETIEREKINRRYYWTASDTKYLQAHWQMGSKVKVAHRLRRSYRSCHSKYNKLYQEWKLQQAS